MFEYVELFAGIGGFRSALDKLGGECVFASEIDKYATQAYRALYNGAPELHGDIRQIDANDIPDHDVLVGGFPCQAFSVAGQRKGFEDVRGTLFFEIARIASAKQPRLMLLENVKGLLSHDGGNTFETMCAVLNDMGYALDFRVLNSKHFGVPQNRERIFIVCSRDAADEPWAIAGNGVVAKAKRRIAGIGVRTFNFDWPTNDAVTTRLLDVLESNVDERYYLSEEKTAKLITQLSRNVNEYDAIKGDVIDGSFNKQNGVQEHVSFTLRSTKNHGVAVPIIAGSLDHYGNDQMNRVYNVDGVAPTITVVSGGGREQKIAEPQVAEPSIEKVGHLPSDSGQTGAVYDANGIAPTCLSQHSNAVTKIAELQQYTDGSGISYTLDANYAKGSPPSDIGKGRRTHVMEPITVQMNRSEISHESDVSHSLMARDHKGFCNQDMTGVIEEVPQVVVEEPRCIQQNQQRMVFVKDEVGTLHASMTNNQAPKILEDTGCSLRTRSYAGQPQQLEIRDEPLSNTLTSVTKDAMVLTTKPRYRIRKLTPRECWRLQGFTDEQHDKVAAAGISDSQRYKQAGNAVTVNVVSAIGRRLMPLCTAIRIQGDTADDGNQD